MIVLKYKVIKSKSQYKEYTKILEELASADFKSKEIKDEIELLTVLIEKWDEENNSFDEVDPITVLHSLMEERNLKAILMQMFTIFLKLDKYLMAVL